MEYGDSTLLNTLLSMILHLSGCVRTWPFPIFHQKLWVLANQGINWGRQSPSERIQVLGLSLESPALCSRRCRYPTAVWEQDILHSRMKFTCAKPHKIYLWKKKIKPNQAFIKSYKREISRYPQACRPYFNNWRPGGKWKIGQNAERISRGR